MSREEAGELLSRARRLIERDAAVPAADIQKAAARIVQIVGRFERAEPLRQDIMLGAAYAWSLSALRESGR